MKQTLRFHGKGVALTLSDRAITESERLTWPLLLEVQLYFSCVLVKRIAIYTAHPQAGAWQLDPRHFDEILQEAQPASGKLFVRFNTVMTKSCPVSTHTGPPPVSDFKIERADAFVPAWLDIDYVAGGWSGDYGWHTERKNNVSPILIRGKS